jgi:NAD(P)-dependent dehydrogenase (short-subunit alcohol dehydrogenase family)
METSNGVVVMDAGADIGRALAVGFAADGYRVTGLGAAAPALARTEALCQDGRFSGVIVDVSDPAALAAAFAAIEGESGPIEVLVCSAWAYPRTFFLDHTSEDWNSALIANVCGVANACRLVLPSMLERNAGRIVVMGSLADVRPIAAASVYSVSKGALHTLVKCLAAEIDADRYPNVLINEYNEGAVRTSLDPGGEEPSALYPRVKRLVDFPPGGPSGRMYLGDREIRLNESLKAKIRRLLLAPLSGRS